MKDEPKLHLQEIEPPPAYRFRAKWWTFMKHKKQFSNYDNRWIIEYRPNDDWWGVVALFPATNEKAIDRIVKEMELAKQAIAQLKGNLLED